MKKRTKVFLVVLTLLLACGIYASHNFQEDKNVAIVVFTAAANGQVFDVFASLDTINRLSNPLINYKFQEFKKGYKARFETESEVIPNNFGSIIVYDLATIYRKYWRMEVLRGDIRTKTDSILYDELSEYLIVNALTEIPRDSLRKVIRNDIELARVIAQEGFKSKFMFRNGFQDLLIWENESIEDTVIILPDSTVDISIVKVEEILLSGFSGYISFGKSKVGGWAIKESPTIYCMDEWQNGSESYAISFLKHEALHHLDLNRYPNLGSADLEYRAKLIEMMYCTDKTIYNLIANWLNTASAEDRSYSHPFANYCIIRDFSRILFQTEYHNDYNAWLDQDVEVLNKTARMLFEDSQKELSQNPGASKILQL